MSNKIKTVLYFLILAIGVTGIIMLSTTIRHRTSEKAKERQASGRPTVYSYTEATPATGTVQTDDSGWVDPAEQTKPADWDESKYGKWAPDTSIEPTPSMAVYTGVYDYDDMTSFDNRNFTYKNDQTLSCSLATDVTLHVGCELDAEFPGLVLALRTEAPTDVLTTDTHSYIITTSTGFLDYSGRPTTAVSYPNGNESEFYVTNWTFDKLVPTRYRDAQNYGVCWTANSSTPDLENDVEVRIYAYTQDNGNLLGVAELQIGYDQSENCYFMREIQSVNLLSSGEITSAERDAFVEAGNAWLEQMSHNALSENFLDMYRNNIVIEDCGRPMHGLFYDTERQLARAGTYLDVRMMAVHIPYPTYGTITYYFAPVSRVYGHAFYADGRVDARNTTWVLIGFEPFKKFTVSTFTQELPNNDVLYFDL